MKAFDIDINNSVIINRNVRRLWIACMVNATQSRMDGWINPYC